jgi:hypothetical protein
LASTFVIDGPPKQLVDAKHGLAKLPTYVESIIFFVTMVYGIMNASLIIMWLVAFDCTHHNKDNEKTR